MALSIVFLLKRTLKDVILFSLHMVISLTLSALAQMVGSLE